VHTNKPIYDSAGVILPKLFDILTCSRWN